MMVCEKCYYCVKELFGDLCEVVDELVKDEVIVVVLGEYVMEYYVMVKWVEWWEYSLVVYVWELEWYLDLV